MKSAGEESAGGWMREGSVASTTLCLIKGAIGASILSMAAHAANVGLLFVIISLVIGALLTVISFRMLGEVSIHTRRWSFEDVSEELFHPTFAFMTGFINAGSCLGACCAYLIICGQVFEVLSGASERWRRLFVVLVGLCICLPLALSKDVNFLRYFSLLSNAALFFLVIAVIFIYAANGKDDSITAHSMWFAKDDMGLFAYMNCMNNIIFSYNTQMVIPKLTGEMRPMGLSHLTSASVWSSVAVCIFYVVVSVFGVLAFGVDASQMETLLLNMAPYRRNALVIIALLSILVSIIVCFEFQIHPIRQFLSYALRKLRGLDADGESRDVRYGGVTLTRWLDLLCAVATVLFSIWIAIALNNLRVILNFMGAFAGAYISFIIPPVWVMRIRSREGKLVLHSFESLVCIVLCLIGAFFFVFGTYAACVA